MSVRYVHPDTGVVVNADGGYRVLEKLGFKTRSVFDDLRDGKQEGNTMPTKRSIQKNEDGSVTKEIKGGYTLVYRAVEGGFTGEITKGDWSVGTIKAKTEKSVISSAYHRVQKLGIEASVATKVTTANQPAAE